VMGYLDTERFAGGRVKLDGKRAESAVAADVAKPLGLDTSLAALAINEIVTENMANAARVHAMELGKTVENYTLIAFGGAAPLHAARLASKLGITRVIVPLSASVGSALGFLTAPVAFQAVRSWHAVLNALDTQHANALLNEMQQQATDMVRAGAAHEPLKTTRVAYMRYQGQGHEIPVTLPAGKLAARDAAVLSGRFAKAYHAMYGRAIPNLGVEIMSWSVTVSTRVNAASRARRLSKHVLARASATRRVFEATQGKPRDAKIYERAQLAPGSLIKGPALVTEDQTTIVVTADFSLKINSLGYAILNKNGSNPA
jgi:N-methylhydantoinase A